MNEQKPAIGQEVHHFVQAAARLGISVQHLMDLERSGAIEPPASLEAGAGRFYTQAELDAIVDRLSVQSSAGSPASARTWWILGAVALLIVVILGFGRGSPPADPPAAEAKPAAERKVRKPAVRPAREDGTEDAADFAEDVGPDSSKPRHPPRIPRTAEQEAEQRELIEESLMQVREQQAKGIYY